MDKTAVLAKKNLHKTKKQCTAKTISYQLIS